MRRGFAITIVYLGLLLVPILLIALIVPPLITEANNFADNVPRYARRRDELRPEEQDAAQAERGLRHHRPSSQKEAGKLPNRLGGAAGTLRDIGLGIVNSLFALLTILVLTAFLSGSGRRMDRRRSSASRPPEQRERLRRSLDNIGSAVSGYVAGALAIAFIAGTSRPTSCSRSSASPSRARSLSSPGCSR